MSTDEDAYLDQCAAIFRRATERHLSRRRRRKVRRRITAASLAVGVIPLSSALLAQEQESDTVVVELVATGAAVVQVDTDAPTDRIIAELREELRALGWKVDVRSARGPEELQGAIYSEYGVRLDDSLPSPYTDRLEIEQDEREVVVIVATEPGDTFEQLGPAGEELCRLIGMSGRDADDALRSLGYTPSWNDETGPTEAHDDPVVMLTRVGPARTAGILSDTIPPLECE